MTAEELIKVLQSVTPDTEVFVDCGDPDQIDRFNRIKKQCEKLGALHVRSVHVYEDGCYDERPRVIIASLEVDEW